MSEPAGRSTYEELLKQSADKHGFPTHCARCGHELKQSERAALGLWEGEAGALCEECRGLAHDWNRRDS